MITTKKAHNLFTYGSITLATFGVGLFLTTNPVSADTTINENTSINSPVNYNSNEIYNNLSDKGKKVYIQDQNSTDESTSLTRGIKKSVVTAALRHGGPAMGKIVGVLNKDAEHYLLQHANLIADTLDSVSSGFKGAVVQALIKVGVPQSQTSIIGWAVELVLV